MRFWCGFYPRRAPTATAFTAVEKPHIHLATKSFEELMVPKDHTISFLLTEPFYDPKKCVVVEVFIFGRFLA